jgi:hypothetical protein
MTDQEKEEIREILKELGELQVKKQTLIDRINQIKSGND